MRPRSITPAVLLFAGLGLLPTVGRSQQVGMISTVAGGGSRVPNDNGNTPARRAGLDGPSGLAVDPSGALLIADQPANYVWRVQANGAIVPVAGNGSPTFSGDGNSALLAALCHPFGVAVDPDGSFVIGDYDNDRVREVDPQGLISTLAGGGAHSPGEGGPATQARIHGPSGVAVDAAGNVFFTERFGGRVSKVAVDGTISIVAGGGDPPDHIGDGGLATQAGLNQAMDVALDRMGDLFIADTGDNRVRKVTAGGIISTVAGGGQNVGDGIPAVNSQLDQPMGVAVDSAGSLFIADTGNNRVLKIGSDGLVRTVAGTGTAGFAGDGGPAALAELNHPSGLAIDAAGNLYVADTQNYLVRKVLGVASPGLIAGRPLPDGSGPVLLKGDVNGDGKVTVADALLALRFVVGLATPTPSQIAAADFKGDGRISFTDVARILRKAIGL